MKRLSGMVLVCLLLVVTGCTSTEKENKLTELDVVEAFEIEEIPFKVTVRAEEDNVLRVYGHIYNSIDEQVTLVFYESAEKARKSYVAQEEMKRTHDGMFPKNFLRKNVIIQYRSDADSSQAYGPYTGELRNVWSSLKEK